MIALIIPARNEADRLTVLLNHLFNSDIATVFIVINGCNDNTLEVIQPFIHLVNIIYHEDPLGYDVPRAIGAHYAFQQALSGVIFIDGDMVGNLNRSIEEIKSELVNGVDLALSNCYPYIEKRHLLATETIKFRIMLNKTLGLYSKIGISSPSHGLMGISRKLFQVAKLEHIAVPPMLLSIAKQHNLNIKVATSIPHHQLGSKIRSEEHAKKIADTIIGDCIQAQEFFLGLPITRTYKEFPYMGYYSSRRFDLIESLKE